jgi:hypothetical protein
MSGESAPPLEVERMEDIEGGGQERVMLTIVFLIFLLGMFGMAGTFLSIEMKRRNQNDAAKSMSRRDDDGAMEQTAPERDGADAA